MTGRYLTNLADVLRNAGLQVREYPGWTSRARSSGGYASGRPFCIMWHHTASPPSMPAEDNARYMTTSPSNSNRPTANLMLDRTGMFWTLAAGATNTNGKGVATNFSKGTVPANAMNTYAIGIEALNNGVGEPWSERMVDAYFTGSNALASAYGLRFNDLMTHSGYAPQRKIDPATAAAVRGRWQPRSINSAGAWNLSDIRNEAMRRGGQPAQRPPQVGDDEMSIRIFESQSNPKEFLAMFFAECDAQGRSIELQWSGPGDDPRVRERVDVMMSNFGPPQNLTLGGTRNNRLHPKHRPSDINDSLHNWTDDDFAP